MNENIKKLNGKEIKFKFLPEEENDLNIFINWINKFGRIPEEKLYFSNINSLIINNNIEFHKLLKTWIESNKNNKTELLFRLTKFGENIAKFHELCDNKGPILIIFFTKDNNIGGIFTPLSWDNKIGGKKDIEIFIFDLNKKEKYKNVDDYQSIYCNSNYGLYTRYFGFENSMRKIRHGGENINNVIEQGYRILSNDLKGVKYFEIKEVEISQIIIKDK